MKQLLCLLSMLFICTSSATAFGQDISERLNALESALKNQAKVIEEQQKTIEALKKEMSGSTSIIAAQQQSAQPPQGSPELKQKVDELNEKVDQVVEAQKKEIPSVFNPAIGLVGETIFSYRSKEKAETGSDRPGGFDAFQRSVELNVSASVDPYAKAYAVINGSADAATGEAALNIEEAAVQTTSLPWNLELKAGRFFGEFGRLAYIHDHELPMVNRPLALDQYIGGESRTDGAQLNWLVPIDHYVSLTIGAGNQFGGDQPPNNVGNTRHLSGINYWGRLASYFDLTPNISLEPGISGLWNPKTVDRGGQFAQADGSILTERERRLVGADLVLSYKPLRNNQFQTLTWGTELLYSNNRYDAIDTSSNPLPGKTVGALGLYSYLSYKFHRQWTTAFLFDYVEDAQNKQAKTYAYSPNLTWNLSHWNQLRFQYTHTDHNASSGLRPDDAVYLQWTWVIGSHSHGWQQR